jgi:hypothetical protein
VSLLEFARIKMALISDRSKVENKENVTLIWFDPKINEKTDRAATTKTLQAINDHVLVYIDLTERFEGEGDGEVKWQSTSSSSFLLILCLFSSLLFFFAGAAIFHFINYFSLNIVLSESSDHSDCKIKLKKIFWDFWDMVWVPR